MPLLVFGLAAPTEHNNRTIKPNTRPAFTSNKHFDTNFNVPSDVSIRSDLPINSAAGVNCRQRLDHFRNLLAGNQAGTLGKNTRQPAVD